MKSIVSSHWRAGELLATIGIIGCLGTLVGSVVYGAVDRNGQCVNNLHALALADLQYIQDYDEKFPQAAVWNNETAFREVINPYLRAKSSLSFTCPATGNVSYSRNSELAGISQATIPNVYATEMTSDSRAHPDGKYTVAFADGHIERGGIDPRGTDAQCRIYESMVLTGLLAYAQDYDEVLPPSQSAANVRALLLPYVSTDRAFTCPDTKQYYSINPAIMGHSLTGFSDRSTIWVVRDPLTHHSGDFTTGYLDSYLEQVNGRGAIIYPDAVSVSTSDLRQLSLALLQYSHDYDGNLPPFQPFSAFKSALWPYVPGSRVFTPRGIQAFQLNTALGGTNLSSYPQPGTTIWIRDNNNYGDDLIGVGYLSGGVDRVKP